MRFFSSTWTLWLGVLLGIPAVYLRLAGYHQLSPALDVFIFGVGIVGAAYVLSVAAEAAQKDIPKSLAIAFLAVLTVLPEYAVDFYFTWQAPHVPGYASYAAANMTGANRLLIGFGWPLLVIIYWATTRRQKILLAKEHWIEMSFLLLATLYAFAIPFKGKIDLLDCAALVGLFVWYIVLATRAGVSEPDLNGASRAVGELEPAGRRALVLLLFAWAGAVILAATEPFSESLVALGKSLGIDEFLLVQWLAPLASESPEIIVATIYALRVNPQDGFGALLSAKVNQWTLLVGTLPLVYSISAGAPHALPLDARQVEEVALTAAQSLFAVLILSDYSISWRESLVLFALFSLQLVIPVETIRWIFAGIYLALSLGMLASPRRRGNAVRLLLAPVVPKWRGPSG